MRTIIIILIAFTCQTPPKEKVVFDPIVKTDTFYQHLRDAKLKKGDTLILEPGIYQERSYMNFIPSGATIIGKGDVTIIAPIEPQYTLVLHMDGKDSTTWQNITFDAHRDSIDMYGVVKITGGASYHKFIDCTFKNASRVGVLVREECYYNEFIDCVMDSILFNPLTTRKKEVPNVVNGYYLAGSHATVKGGKVSNVSGSGIAVFNSSSAISPDSNRVESVDISRAKHGIQIAEGVHTIVENNNIHDNREQDIYITIRADSTAVNSNTTQKKVYINRQHNKGVHFIQ